MMTYSDVTDDPTARERSSILEERLEEAARLDFRLYAWTCSIPDELLPNAKLDDSTVVTAVLVGGDRRAFLELSRTKEVDDHSFTTIFEDGTVLNTCRKPPARFWWLHRAGLEDVPARHRYELAYHDVSSLAELASIHEARVAAAEKRGLRVVTAGDLATYFSIRMRWREIDDPRVEAQTKISASVGLATAAFGIVASMAAGVRLAPSMGARALFIAVAGTLLALGAGFGAFVLAHLFVAPRIARRASAPPPRPARELRRLAEHVKRGRLPPRGARADGVVGRKEPEAPATIPVDLSPADLARARKIDLVVTTANGLVLPVAMLAALAVLGTAGIWVALGIVFTVDGAIGIIMKKTRAQLVRERLVPELARAWTVCTSKSACALGKIMPYLWIVYGVAGLYTARQHLALPRDPVPDWLVLECCGIIMIAAHFALTGTKRRHKQFVPA